MSSQKSRYLIGCGAILASMTLFLTGCSGAGGSSNSGKTVLNVAMVNNPQMKDLQELKAEFEQANSDIELKLQLEKENDLRDKVTKDISTKGGQYDVVTIGSYETPIWAKNGWLADITDKAKNTEGYDVDDILPAVKDLASVDSKLYAAPFYAESSFLMYNKDILSKAGVTLSERPTWQEVAEVAKKTKTADTAGICLRGKPGWGEMFAALTPVVQTFGGNWYDNNWKAGVDSPEFKEAVKFYTDLQKEAGQPDPTSSGFTECLNVFSSGKAAMWYDATSAAGSLESQNLSKVAGNVGYVRAPTVKTQESGWLWSWNFAIPQTSKKTDAAWKFVSWATSKDYIKKVGEKFNDWSRIPPASRQSSFDLPGYQKVAAPFAPLTKEIMNSVNPKQPGVNPQPWVGIQYVTIPEFQDIGNRISQNIADVVSGKSSVDDALNKSQPIAQEAGDKQKK